jgi:citrate lyase subunit beta/citryl-CoA lyase
VDPLRSSGAWLYVPATRPDRFASAAASGAERVVIDLEDTVPPGEKRAAARALREATLPTAVPVYLRVNGPGTEWHGGDLAVAAGLAIAGILLPRAEAAHGVLRAAGALPDHQQVIPVVETAAGVWNVLEVARTRRVERLALGALDLQLDAGMQEGGAGVVFARAQLVLASRVAGLAPPLDTVTLAVDDEAAVVAAARQARRDGFGGKLCVHPRQIPAVRRAFAPDTAELEWAEAVLRAAAERGGGDHDPFLFRGALVDRPVLDRALRTVGQRQS